MAWFVLARVLIVAAVAYSAALLQPLLPCLQAKVKAPAAANRQEWDKE